jgi:hypothetical protein
MADVVPGDVNVPYNTYADYVASNYGDGWGRYSWLVNFLRKGYVAYREPERSRHILKIHVLDVRDDALKSRTFSASRSGPVDPSFLTVLSERSKERKVRLILVQCPALGDINVPYIDAIGLRYMLHPSFFSAQFELGRNIKEADNIFRESAPVLLPSERRFLQIITDRNSFMTATWEICDAESTCMFM